MYISPKKALNETETFSIDTDNMFHNEKCWFYQKYTTQQSRS